VSSTHPAKRLLEIEASERSAFADTLARFKKILNYSRTGRNRSAVYATLPTCLSMLFRSSTPHAASLLAFFGAALIVLFHRPAVLECSPPLRPISDICPRSEMTASLPFRLRLEYVYGPLPSSERHVRLHARSRVLFVVHRSESTIRSIFFCQDPSLLNIYGLESFVKSVIPSETFVTDKFKFSCREFFSTRIGGHCAVRLEIS
jgi:hypothetical protein